MQTVLVGISPC